MYRYVIEHQRQKDPRIVYAHTQRREDSHAAYLDLLAAAGPMQLRAYYDGAAPPYFLDMIRDSEPAGVAWLEDDAGGDDAEGA